MKMVFCIMVLWTGGLMQSFSQSVYTNPSFIAFDSSLTTVKDSLSIWIVNNASMQIEINDINIYGEAFSIKDTSFILNGHDSTMTWIYFTSSHNLSYNEYLFVETNLVSGSVVVPVSGTKKYAEVLYSSTQGKSGEPLKTALTAITKTGHTALGYTIARDRMYGNIDSNNGLDSVECIYTGRKAKFNTRATATSNNFNCEHTWPQSKFSEADPMVSDIHHLFSSDEAANSKRSNFPFGVVVTSSWNVGGSKYGSGYGGQTVFEPRDIHKGDCARAMFYFVVRHGNPGSFWAESPYQESAFRDWNKKFPPTTKSKSRNNGIQQYQGNRNPFIDHPEFVERINNFGGTATIATAPNLVASPMDVCHAKVDVGQQISWFQTLANIGNAPLKITSAVFSNPFYSLVDSISDIETNGFRKVGISYKPTLASTDSLSTLTLKYSDGVVIKTVIVNLKASSIPTSVKDHPVSQPKRFYLEQNYPNPFNPSTEIRFTIPVSGFIALKIYNVLGEVVSVLVNDRKEVGSYQIKFNSQHLPSGMYFYSLSTRDYTETKRMILMK